MNIGLLMALVAAEAAAAAPGKLSPAVSKEMTESIIAVNKVLGLESWTMRGGRSWRCGGGSASWNAGSRTWS